MIVYVELEKLIKERGTKLSAVALTLGITTRTLRNKLEGLSQFNWRETCMIQKHFFPDKTKDELFGDTPPDKSA